MRVVKRSRQGIWKAIKKLLNKNVVYSMPDIYYNKDKGQQERV
jgi:hypothetical protein